MLTRLLTMLGLTKRQTPNPRTAKPAPEVAADVRNAYRERAVVSQPRPPAPPAPPAPPRARAAAPTPAEPWPRRSDSADDSMAWSNNHAMWTATAATGATAVGAAYVSHGGGDFAGAGGGGGWDAPCPAPSPSYDSGSYGSDSGGYSSSDSGSSGSCSSD